MSQKSIQKEKWLCFKKKAFCKIDSKLKIKPKTNSCFFLDFSCVLFTPQVHIIHENAIIIFFFFSFENGIFTLSTSSSSSIYKIVITINTPTTMNNQFEALNAPQIDLHSLFLTCYELKTTSLSLCLHIHPKNSSFWFKFFFMVDRAIQAYYSWWVTFVWGSGWLEKTMCAKEVISLV